MDKGVLLICVCEEFDASMGDPLYELFLGDFVMEQLHVGLAQQSHYFNQLQAMLNQLVAFLH